MSLALAGCMNGGGSGTTTEEETTTEGETTTTEGEETTTEGETTTDGEETTTDGEGTTTGGGELQLERREGQAPPGIQVENLQIQETDSGATVTGTITNAGDTTYDQIEVQVTLLDDSDDVLGQYFDNTEEEDIVPLEPQEQFEFSVDFPAADLGDAVGYRVDVDTDIDEGFDPDWDVGTTSTGTGTGT